MFPHDVARLTLFDTPLQHSRTTVRVCDLKNFKGRYF